MCLACLLSLFAFSTVTSADELDIKPYEIEIESYISGYVNQYFGKKTITPNNGVQEYDGEKEYNITGNSNFSYYYTRYKVRNVDGSIFIPRGRKATIKLNNAYHSLYYKPKNIYVREPTEVRVYVSYTNNTGEYFEDVEYMQTRYDTTIDFSFEFTPEYDVSYIEFQVDCDYTFDTSGIVVAYLGEVTGDVGFNLFLEQQSEESGLLSGLIEWVKEIFNKVGDIWDAIVELPAKLWEKIQNGLMSLFVPSDEYLTEYKDRFDTMLQEKLGAVYQVLDLTFDGWDRIQMSDETDIIDFPEVTIPLPDNEEFTFGGQEVQIVPDGFDILVTAVKTIVGMCCTILFVNGLRNRYEEIMGVEK